jgi:DNA modification methylase
MQPPAVQNGYFTGRDLGTFKDARTAPIHRWFSYPAGYSYKFVFEAFDLFNVNPDDWVYDPFSGTGTTLIAAKQQGINAYGVEAHEFVHWVSQVKLYWGFDLNKLHAEIHAFLRSCREMIAKHRAETDTAGTFPDLIYKCYHTDDLTELYLIREHINQYATAAHLIDLLKLALTRTLRQAALAGTGWPYIAPRKADASHPPKGGFTTFMQILWEMYHDLATLSPPYSSSIHNILGDSREQQQLESEQVKLVVTSPPYLNNYDYADRTRLETYFWGITASWRDITTQFRDKLITAATTQIVRRQHDVATTLNPAIRQIAPDTYHTLQSSILALSERRLTKGGKKDYDLMVALYFTDMLQVLSESFRVLQKGGYACLVLGDSAPYGVHIPTDDVIGQLGLGLGFKDYQYHLLRSRGGKWKDNPQRHSVPLREGVVLLRK